MTNLKSVLRPVSRLFTSCFKGHGGDEAASQARPHRTSHTPKQDLPPRQAPLPVLKKNADHAPSTPPLRPRARRTPAPAPVPPPALSPDLNFSEAKANNHLSWPFKPNGAMVQPGPEHTPTPSAKPATPPPRKPSWARQALSHVGVHRITVETPFTQFHGTRQTKNLGVRTTARPPSGCAPTTPPAAVASPQNAKSPALGTPPCDAQDLAGSPHLLAVAMEKNTPKQIGAVIQNQFNASPLAVELVQDELQRWSPPPSCAPSELPGMPKVLMVQALAGVTEGNAWRAAAALQTLRTLHPMRELTTAWHAAHSTTVPPAMNQAHSDAWRVAAALAATPSGMAVLQSALAQPVPEDAQDTFALWLKAAAHLGTTSASVEPEALLQAQRSPQSVAGQALHCATARLVGKPEAGTPYDWALNAVRNDLYDTAPGSDFAAIHDRLTKMVRSIDLAAGDKWYSLRNPMAHKSAFRALRHGLQEVERGQALRRHRNNFDKALDTAVTRQHKHLMRSVEAPLETHKTATHLAGPKHRPPQAPKSLLRAAVLAHCMAHPIDGYRFNSEAAVADITQRLTQMMHLPEGAHPSLQKQVRAAARQPMSLERLERWLDDTLRDAMHDAPKHAPPPPWYTLIRAQLDNARKEAHGANTEVHEINRKSVKKSLKTIVEDFDSSSQLQLSSGGITAIGLKQAAATFSSLISGLLFRVRLDARKQWGRRAGFEIGRSTYDMRLSTNTQRQSTVQVGVGAALGPDLGIGKATFASVDGLLYGKDQSDIQGASLRLPQSGRSTEDLRKEMARLIDCLLDHPAPGTPKQPPLLQHLLQEFPTLTVNHIGKAKEKRRRHGLSAEGGASISMPFCRASATIGANVEVQRGYQKHYRDATGSMRVERHTQGHFLRGGLTGKVVAGLSLPVGPAKLSSGNTDVTLIAASAELLLAGHTQRREVVLQDQRLQDVSFVEDEYQNVESFRQHMEPHIDTWAQARVNAPNTQRSLEAERHRFREFVQTVCQDDTAHHSYIYRRTITAEAAAHINAYRSGAVLAAHFPTPQNQQAIHAFEARAERVWQQPAALQPSSLRAYKRASAQSLTGPNLVMQVAAIHAAEASHVDNRFDVA